MWEFLRAGGLFMIPLVLTSIVGVGFIIERGLALRWPKVIPPNLETAVETCSHATLPDVKRLCQEESSPLGRLLLVAQDNLSYPKEENIDVLETHARHEVLRLERGLVVLEIVVGIAPLLGLVGAIHGLITLFGSLGQSGVVDNSTLARGISEALNTTLAGLLIAIPSLIAWSYYNKKVESLAVEMETICDKFLRCAYRDKKRG
jgi:biopolymer transport protein ExbB